MKGIGDWVAGLFQSPTVDLLQDEISQMEEERQAIMLANMKLARQLAEACKERDAERNRHLVTTEAWVEMHKTLRTIAYLGGMSKNGTARKLARMAREELE